ncbi:hypothetical protein VPNG_05898 [Cytospora leucostoma]|uniref:Uncharacterized protein n=1 Tax=Cytospora leucostoma TaxID=1230097 RepID=A0A423X076_9PEZI|nr:hypothetical protein VPNG_05898 [Cytospora leucostoma]
MAGTVIITGANGSLAVPAVHHLLTNFPSYTLILTVRDASGEDPNTRKLRDVLGQHPQADVSIRQLDLGMLASVHQFARRIATEVAEGHLPPVASIICNAYYWNLARPLELTGDGYEKTFQVTHLAHAALVLRLLGSFQQHGGRIVFFSSDATFPGQNSLEKIPPLIPDNLDFLVHPPPDEKNDNLAYGFHRYANAKLSVVMWAHALNRRLVKEPRFHNITAVIVNPGNLSDSRALRTNTPAMLRCMSSLVIRPFQPLLRMVDPTMRSSAEAGKDIALLATNTAHPSVRGYFTLLEKADSPKASLDEQKQDELWLQSARWIRLLSSTEEFILISIPVLEEHNIELICVVYIFRREDEDSTSVSTTLLRYRRVQTVIFPGLDSYAAVD